MTTTHRRTGTNPPSRNLLVNSALALSLFVGSAEAQYGNNNDYYYRRNRRNRIIAGVISTIAFLFLLAGIMMMMKRRRQSRIIAHNIPIHNGQSNYHNPYTQGGQQQPGFQHQQSGYGQQGSYYGQQPGFQHQQSGYGQQQQQSGYMSPSAAPPPPPYTAPKEMEGQTGVNGEQQQQQSGGFAPPAGPPPPPAAHTNGNTNTGFFGRFRS